MNKHTAKALLENLLERIAIDDHGSMRLEGKLTVAELKALKTAIDCLGGNKSTVEIPIQPTVKEPALAENEDSTQQSKKVTMAGTLTEPEEELIDPDETVMSMNSPEKGGTPVS